MNAEDRFNEYINSHPRESLMLVLFALMLIWQTIPALIGMVLYVVLIRLIEVNRWLILGTACFIVLEAIYLSQSNLSANAITLYLKQGLTQNSHVWRYLLANQPMAAFSYALHADHYFLGSPLFMAGILSVIDLIPNSPHESKMKALQKGLLHSEQKELNDKQIERALNKLNDEHQEGTVLGVSKFSGKPVIIPDRYINQIALVLGTTGSGKTVTLSRFYQRAMRQKYPLIIVDGKPDTGTINQLIVLAKQYGRQFIGFNCGNYLPYDALAHGNFTELKDKIVCLKDTWENDYYRSIAEDYLQTTFEVLLKLGGNLDLKRVVECLSYNKLKLLAAETKDESLIDRVRELKNYERKDITGLQAHLNILINSELGRYFDKTEQSFSLTDVINQQAVVYFALPALRFPSFAKVLGKLVINDIKAVIDRNRDYSGPVFTVFDEFSVFAGEQVLNLVNMGRGKGIHAIFGTQGLADLDKVDVSFKNQVLNCVNTLICHQLNDQDSAETVANWVGTTDAFTLTAQLNMKESEGGLGSVRVNKEYIVHPDAIKQGLRTGEAFCVTKVAGFKKEKLCVKL